MRKTIGAITKKNAMRQMPFCIKRKTNQGRPSGGVYSLAFVLLKKGGGLGLARVIVEQGRRICRRHD